MVVCHENEINAQTFLCLDNKKNHRQRHSKDHGHYHLCGLLVSSLITVTSPPPQNGFAKLIFDGFLVGNFWFFYFPTISLTGNNFCNEGTITTDTVFLLGLRCDQGMRKKVTRECQWEMVSINFFVIITEKFFNFSLVLIS